MSILQTPRINFMGQIAWDPIVTNNYPKFYDENTSETVMPQQDPAQGFRQEAIDAVTSGNWNPHGTHRSQFFDTRVNSVDLGQGPVTDDPVCGQPMNFTGMLVDLEPYGAYTSQLFFDLLSLGIQGGAQISATRQFRFTDRYINFQRNPVGYIAGVASVNWQTSFAIDKDLSIQPHGSPALQALVEALKQPDALGLTVRFNTYRTTYYDDDSLRNGQPNPRAKQLQDKLNVGGFQPNPARSILVGSIGIWRSGESIHEPSDRALIANPNSNVFVASAHARLQDGQFTLDLANSICETGMDLTKQDLGTLSVVAINPATGADLMTLGQLQYEAYSRTAYEVGAGIVSFAVSEQAAQIAAHANLVLRQADGNVLLSEAPYRALPLTPNAYIDEQSNGTMAQFQVYLRGQPLMTQTPVTIYQMSADGGTVQATYPLMSNAQGLVSLSVLPTVGGGIVAFVADPLETSTPPDPNAGINTQVSTYMYVRTIAADQATAQLAPTWENVYNKVLINWKAMAPCMDNWLDLANPDQVKAYAKILKKLTDPNAFESFRFMPVTRDMTAGERSLLYAFLDTPSESLLTKSSTKDKSHSGKPAPMNYTRLSRSHRAAE